MKRAIRALVVLAALFVLGAASVWLVVRDEVAAVRSMAARAAEPLPPHMEAAIRAAESPILERPQFTLRARRLLSPRTVACGPPLIAYVVVRFVSPPRRMLRWHFETFLATQVVGRLYTPEELLRILAHNAYFGTIDGDQILGVGAASRAYFGKAPPELTIAEAATLAGIMRQPSYYSPRTHPDRALDRRNKVLQEMRRRNLLSQVEFEREQRSPL